MSPRLRGRNVAFRSGSLYICHECFKKQLNEMQPSGAAKDFSEDFLVEDAECTCECRGVRPGARWTRSCALWIVNVFLKH